MGDVVALRPNVSFDIRVYEPAFSSSILFDGAWPTGNKDNPWKTFVTLELSKDGALLGSCMQDRVCYEGLTHKYADDLRNLKNAFLQKPIRVTDEVPAAIKNLFSRIAKEDFGYHMAATPRPGRQLQNG